jgi:hypothetical protein
LAEKLLEVPQGLIHTALDLEQQDRTVIADRVGETDCIFLAGLHGAERAVAERLLTPRLRLLGLRCAKASYTAATSASTWSAVSSSLREDRSLPLRSTRPRS